MFIGIASDQALVAQTDHSYILEARRTELQTRRSQTMCKTITSLTLHLQQIRPLRFMQGHAAVTITPMLVRWSSDRLHKGGSNG